VALKARALSDVLEGVFLRRYILSGRRPLYPNNFEDNFTREASLAVREVLPYTGRYLCTGQLHPGRSESPHSGPRGNCRAYLPDFFGHVCPPPPLCAYGRVYGLFTPKARALSDVLEGVFLRRYFLSGRRPLCTLEGFLSLH